MDSSWKVDRHTETQSLSQQSQTRILQSQRLNFIQTKFPSSIMDGFVEEGDGGDAAAKLMKQRFEKLSFGVGNGGGGPAGDINEEMSLCTTMPMPMTMTMPSLPGFDDSRFGSRMQEMGFNKLLGGSGIMTDGVVTSMRSEKAQVFAASRSSTIQSSQGSVSSSSLGPQILHQMPSSSSMNNAAWMNMNMNMKQSDLNVKQEMAASMTGLKHSTTTNSAGSTSVSTGAAISAGVTRSFSSSSGFPIPPSSSIFSQQNTVPDGESLIPSSSRVNHCEIPSLDNFVSPFKRPFGFRNFDRPLFSDMSGSFRDNHRMTWDPSTIQAMKSSTSQVQFQQRTVFQSSVNGSIRAYKDERVSLRQSYGASESESEDEDDDDDIKMLTYETKKALPYEPKLAICDKPEYPPSESDDVSVTTLEPDQSPTSDGTIGSAPITPEHRRCHKVAQELLTTERTYVRILHLIDQVFHFRVDQENRANPMFSSDTITQMFGNIKSLYALHCNHLLPQLEKRLSEWEEDQPRIGDVLKEFAPFLKMYSEYVQNFDNAINLINVYKEKNNRFANIINEVQKMEACGNLPIQHHLIGPIQRIPRYRLLLEAYLRKLPETSPDREDTQKALEIVSKAAEHANEAMRRIASFKKLLEVQEQVKGAVDLVSPTRTLIKEGAIKKISARTSDHQERYIFLFSDMVLLCSFRPMANMISSAPYQLRAKLEIAQMTVNEGDDLEVVNTFYIQDSNKRIELYTSTAEEKKSWMEQMWQARIDLMERKSSLRLGNVSPSEDLGLKEPAKLKTDSVSKCMELSCGQPFTMLKRKHHCHACGAVVCAKCSGVKQKLPYAGSKLCRVCKSCRSILEERGSAEKKNGNSSSPSSPDEPLERVKGVLDVPASSASVASGYLSLRLRGKKDIWTSRYFTLRKDFVLYCYAKDTDAQAMTATPMPGMNVVMVDQLPKSEPTNLSNAEKVRALRIAHEHGRKVFLFLAESREEALTWVKWLQLASKAELLQNGNEGNHQP